jgi:Helicase conserved C-terminal domain
MTDTHLEGCYAFRRELLEELHKDLIGPLEEDEIIRDAPLDQYVTGVLYPAGERADSFQDDGSDPETGGDQTAAADPPVAMASVRNPSSLGLTFAVAASAGNLRVFVDAARYEPSGTQDERQRRGRIGAGDVTWQRRPVRAEPVQIRVDTEDAGSYRPVTDRSGDEIEGVSLFVRVRGPDENERRPVTVALVNTLKADGAAELRDAYAFLQVSLRIDADGDAVFVERPARISTLDAEHRSNALIYRHARTYAVGHGCSAGWTFAEGSEVDVTEVWTTFMPQHELLLSDSNDEITAQSLGMQWITTAARTQVIDDLNAFCDNYAAWIESQKKQIPQLEAEHQETAKTHLRDCFEVVGRMRNGVNLLAGPDETVWEAFVLANRAMLEQRARADWLAAEERPPKPQPSDTQRWRPFQLGFILLCLEGIAEPTSEDRSLTDLLWFPTGGGKTEAYLGLIAFTTFLRRLRAGGAGGGGVTALMRYTLRLLTSQQFQRATLLICACESIRSKDTRIKDTPKISIGLWVGEGATPNRHYGNEERPGTRESLAALGRRQELTTLNPVQLTVCPWCGTALDRENYWLKKHPQLHLVVQCKTEGCEFKDGLPVWVIDEDIYRERPTLLIATLDKYAALPWRPEVGNLFNLESDDGAPDLVIQDELHLISGPLGTLAGLYETAVATLATHDGIPPKVVASTATIRRAGRQGKGLFAQETRQFPPPALDSRNSYFAVQAARTERGSRLYTGLMAAGKSQTTLLIRAYAALLQSALELPAASDQVRDAYWTLVGYFNSLRVLAAARLAVLDDVTEWIDRLAARDKQDPRTIEQRIELTSRESSSKIPRFLKDMTISYPDPMAVDVILATNMISVGVDIDRLGLMVVMGQPQGTSEYIQATSRVGRQSPGLVATLLNASRSRDRSHYEDFIGYHSSLYRQVESTSVTPFSSRARDRALHAIVIALTRHLIPQMRDNSAAALIHQQEDEIRRVVWPIIAARLSIVDESEKDEAEREFGRVLADWKARSDEVARTGEKLVYYQYRGRARSLLWEAGADAANGSLATEAFPTQRSLRDVDTTTHLDLVP